MLAPMSVRTSRRSVRPLLTVSPKTPAYGWYLDAIDGLIRCGFTIRTGRVTCTQRCATAADLIAGASSTALPEPYTVRSGRIRCLAHDDRGLVPTPNRRPKRAASETEQRKLSPPPAAGSAYRRSPFSRTEPAPQQSR